MCSFQPALNGRFFFFFGAGDLLLNVKTNTPGGGHSHMSVDIKCLSIDPLFYADPTPNDPLFYSVHTLWPPFFHFCIKFYIKIANFCALSPHFEKFNDFVAILTENLQILPWNCIIAHWMTPIFWESTPKKPPFFLVLTPNDPLFRRNLTLNSPFFRSPVGTCTSLSYLSAPPRGRIPHRKYKIHFRNMSLYGRASTWLAW